jgi:dihydrofolate synthase/folylpolyglutamate synthase
LISDPFGDRDRAERGLFRMRALLRELGDPHLAVPVVHVAGSKGKGSTGAFIAGIAGAAGYRSGHYSSPHLHRFPERIAVNGHPLADEEFAAVTRKAAAAAVRAEAADTEIGQVTTFELVTAMAFVAFAARSCDLAVIEVGLGGTYDATNVVSPTLSVITRIDLEHTAVLGSTHEEIAAQKAGILRTGIPAVTSPQVRGAAETIAAAARQIGAPLLMGGRDWWWTGDWRSFAATGPWGEWRGLGLGIPGPHQVENACTALAAVYVLAALGTPIPQAAVRAGLSDTHWPARGERIAVAERTVMFDGAHTAAAGAALVATWRELDLPEPAAVILGMSADKDPAAFLASLRPLLGRLILTRADSPRAADPATLGQAAATLGIPYTLAPAVPDAIAAAVASNDAPLLITGSLFVAAEAREAFGLAAPDVAWQELQRNAERPRDADSPRDFAPQ